MRKKELMKNEVKTLKFFPMNLQFFAEEAEDEEIDGEETAGGDDPDDEESDEDGEDEPKFTQAEMDKAIKARIRRERRKWKAEAAKGSGETGKINGNAAEESAGNDAVAKENGSLRAKLACYEAGVTKEAVDDVAILANAYMQADDTLDLEEAIEMVIEKHPGFVKKSEPKESEEKPRRKVYVKSTQQSSHPKQLSQNEAYLAQRYAGNPYYKKSGGK